MINTESELENISVEIVGGLNNDTRRFNQRFISRNGYDI